MMRSDSAIHVMSLHGGFSRGVTVPSLPNQGAESTGPRHSVLNNAVVFAVAEVAQRSFLCSLWEAERR